MRRRIDRSRLVRARVTAVGAGALVAAASVVPATAAQASTTTTVHGTVQSGSTRLAGVPVGFWSRTGHRLAGTTTGPSGAFTLRVPSGARGFAYAGVRPDASKAVFALGEQSYIRGVIGAGQGRTTSYRLYQGHPSATAAGLAGGGTLRFRLQKPGRIAVRGGAHFHGNGGVLGVIDVLRLNGSPVGRTVTDHTTGTATSRLLIPGSYRVRAIPQNPYLPRTVSVTVRAGSTTTIAPTFAKGATLSGVLTGPGQEPAAGVRVTVLHHSLDRPPSVLTDANGRYAIRGLGADTYRLRIGYGPERDPEDDLPSVVPPLTSDDWLPVTTSFPVDAAHSPVREDVTLAEAGHVTGKVTSTRSLYGARVWLETDDHAFVRMIDVADGSYTLGGLQPGTHYTAYVLGGTSADPRYGSASFTATAGTLTEDLVMETKTLTLSGTLTGGGWVETGSSGPLLPTLEAGSAHGEDPATTGHYTVTGLIPGVYDLWQHPPYTSGRTVAGRGLLTLTDSTTKDFGLTPRAAGTASTTGTYRARFVSGAAPFRHVDVLARDAAGDEAQLWMPPSGVNSTGTVTVSGLAPGSYRYRAASFAGGTSVDNVPAIDGPWWFGAVSRSFTIRAGRTTDDGTIALHVHGTL